MRITKLVTVAVMAAMFSIPAWAGDDDKGTMEKFGAAVDKKLEDAREFFSDGAVKARIIRRLMEDDRVSAKDIRVNVNEGVATLEGDTPSEEIAQRVVDIAKATEGVKSVENKLSIITRVPSKTK